MRTTRGTWSLAGIVAGAAGVATSYAVAMAMTIRESPVVAVGELVVKVTPGAVVDRLVRYLGALDKPLLVLGILLLLTALFAWTGRLARRAWWAPIPVYAALAALGAVAVLLPRSTGTIDLVPVLVGLATWLVGILLLTDPLRRSERAEQRAALPADDPRHIDADQVEHRQRRSRRAFVVLTALVAGGSAVVALVGRTIGSGRRHVEETRRLLRLPGVTEPQVPARARLPEPVEGLTPWVTPAEDFYRVDTALVVPTIEPDAWRLRIHGMVERELLLTYDDLLARDLTEAWVTLTCVSNPVGGDLAGNAWWSGVRVAELLAEAGVHPDADAVLQTSEDGWTCGTPLVALTDNRDALLAVAMNGQALPIEHGFPVRTVVPGLYGYVSATKWVVDMEVTRFSDIEAYWTSQGWAEQAPIKLASRIDVPSQGAEVPAADLVLAGVAWAQPTGIRAVEIALDGGPWQPAEVAVPPTNDTWVQWSARVDVEPGDHLVRVRATDKFGLVQTGVERDVRPDGATGWHTVEFSVTS
ncbi:molybdopterin-dependent oxidoreductase [Nocardioides ferulae]|uniref:molybdopterin-dependent oxidoreductase n=1 Tax=Nocardioides ferulae TaxID=2340821 RepID=UPI001F0CA0AC|nr:molybdopterin-dependent oxidoreductase [Nocardioides ferulae]